MTQLPDRGVIELAGEDRISFLQGLVSNDIDQAIPGHAIWAALLTPQGKWLSDFFVLSDGERLLLDCPRADTPSLVTRLTRYRLRARATLRDASGELTVHAAWDGTPELPPGTVAAPDPRLPEAGWRILADTALPTNATAADWNAHRLALGLPDNADLEREKTTLLEAGFDELNGVSWTKGCYMGQELTARTKYRGLVKRRLVPVTIDGPLPAPGTPITCGEQEVGTMRSGQNHTALALLRLEALNQSPLTCGPTRITPNPPTWLRMPVTT